MFKEPPKRSTNYDSTLDRDTSGPIRLLRLPEVKDRTGLSRSSINLRVSDGTFPKPVSLGARAIAWVESEVERWLRVQIAQSRDSSQ